MSGRDSCLVLFLFSAKGSASCCLVTLALTSTLHRTRNFSNRRTFSTSRKSCFGGVPVSYFRVERVVLVVVW